MSFAIVKVGVGWNNKIVHTAARNWLFSAVKYNVPGAATPSSVWTQTALVFSAPHQRFAHRCLTPKKRVGYSTLFSIPSAFSPIRRIFRQPYSPGSRKIMQHSVGLPYFYRIFSSLV